MGTLNEEDHYKRVIKMSSNDLVKYMTQQVVSYIDQPKEERQQQRAVKKAKKQPFLFRWFGIIPMSVTMFMKKKKRESSDS